MVRLSAEGCSQREVGKLLGVLQGCVGNFVRCNRGTGGTYQWRHGGRRSLITAQGDRELIRMVTDNRSTSAPRLSVEMFRRFWRRLSVRSFVKRLPVAGYQSRRPTGCSRLILGHRRRPRVCGKMHRRWDLRHWTHCVFNDEPCFTLFHNDGCVLCVAGNDRDW